MRDLDPVKLSHSDASRVDAAAHVARLTDAVRRYGLLCLRHASDTERVCALDLIEASLAEAIVCSPSRRDLTTRHATLNRDIVIAMAREAGLAITLDGTIGRERYESVSGPVAALTRFGDRYQRHVNAVTLSDPSGNAEGRSS